MELAPRRGAGSVWVYRGWSRSPGWYTPLPLAYTLLLHWSAYLFCVLLPFGLASTAGCYTPLFTAFVIYSCFGLDALFDEIEQPFSVAENDLALVG
jgi:putative membrane protein